MALKVSTTLQGLPAPNCYARAARIVGDSKSVRIYVERYADEPARTANKSPLETEVLDFVPDLEANKNVWKQAYDKLKALPGYSGAQDV